VLLLGLIVLSIDFSAVDGEEPALVSRVAAPVVAVLGQPGFAVHGAMGERATDLTEWAVFVGNSLVWGAVLSLLLRLRRRREA
jgi:hypothetical protein